VIGRAVRLSPLATWRADALLSVDVATEPVLRLASSSDGPFALDDPAGTLGGLADPIGGAVDCEGRAYRVHGDRLEIYTCDGWVPVPCLTTLASPRGMTTTPTCDVVVVERGAARLLILAPEAVAIRRIVHGPPGWAPWDVASWRGRLLVSDPDGGVVHVLTQRGRPLTTWDGSSSDPAVEPFGRPTAIAVDREDRVYVVDADSGLAHVFDDHGDVVEVRETTEGLDDRFCAPVLTVDPVTGEVARVCDVLPPLVVYALSGRFVTARLDSKRHRCQWHRVRLRGIVPTGTTVQVFTATSEIDLDPAEVAALPADRWAGGQVHDDAGSRDWDCLVLSAPGRYLWLRLELVGNGRATPCLESVLVEHPRITSANDLPAAYREEPTSADFTERFMAILDETRDSVDREIDAVPTLLDPAAAPASADPGHDFLGYLAGWLGIAAEIRLPESRLRVLVARAHELYRLRGTPAGVALHLEICLGRRPRILEDYAMRRWLYLGSGRLGDCATLWGDQVVARFQLDSGAAVGTSALVGSTDPLRDPFHVNAHRFQVYLPLRHGEDEAELTRVAERVLEVAKPAHTSARLVIVHPRMRVGVQSYLGVDSVVAAYPSETREGESRLGYDSVLPESTTNPSRPSLRVGQTTRLGTTTVLD